MGNGKALISVIVGVYNGQRYLGECLDSVLDQSYGNLEVIVVDDGSTDASPQIVDAYAKRDERVVPIHQENKGVSAARNRGRREGGICLHRGSGRLHCTGLRGIFLSHGAGEWSGNCNDEDGWEVHRGMPPWTGAKGFKRSRGLEWRQGG